MSGSENVPLPPSVTPGDLVQVSINKFDHEEGKSSRSEGSHDTIMVVFQNHKQCQDKAIMSKLEFTSSCKRKSIQNLNKHNLT